VIYLHDILKYFISHQEHRWIVNDMLMSDLASSLFFFLWDGMA